MKKNEYLDIFYNFKNKVIELNGKRVDGPDAYLDSIDYMLSSKLYVDSILEDLDFLFKNSDVNKEILDFGAGSGFLSDALSLKFKKVYGLETNDMSKMVEYTTDKKEREIFQKSLDDKKRLWEWVITRHQNVDIAFYGGEKIPFVDNYFSNICAYAVVEHLSADLAEKILSELYRITKNNGKLFIFKLPQTFSAAEFFAKIFGLGNHLKKFSKKEIIVLLSKAGWKIEKIFYSDFVFEFPSGIANVLYYPLKVINKIIAKTPFKLFGHNFVIVAVKK